MVGKILGDIGRAQENFFETTRVPKKTS